MSRNRIGGSGSQSRPKSASPTKVMDVRQLLEEKRSGHSQQSRPPPVAASGKTGVLLIQKFWSFLLWEHPETEPTLFVDVRQRLGKRRYSPDRGRSPSPVSPRETPPAREPIRDVHRRLGVASQDNRGLFSNSSKDRKTSKKGNFSSLLLCSPSHQTLITPLKKSWS